MLESKYVTQGLEINSKPAIAPPLANAKRQEDDGIATCPLPVVDFIKWRYTRPFAGNDVLLSIFF